MRWFAAEVNGLFTFLLIRHAYEIYVRLRSSPCWKTKVKSNAVAPRVLQPESKQKKPGRSNHRPGFHLHSLIIDNRVKQAGIFRVLVGGWTPPRYGWEVFTRGGAHKGALRRVTASYCCAQFHFVLCIVLPSLNRGIIPPPVLVKITTNN